MRFTIADVTSVASGSLAWVTCTEDVRQSVQGRISVTSVLATNLFERGADGWRMIHHHASHVVTGSAEPA